jgi:hypothetical protein
MFVDGCEYEKKAKRQRVVMTLEMILKVIVDLEAEK